MSVLDVGEDEFLTKLVKDPRESWARRLERSRVLMFERSRDRDVDELDKIDWWERIGTAGRKWKRRECECGRGSWWWGCEEKWWRVSKVKETTSWALVDVEEDRYVGVDWRAAGEWFRMSERAVFKWFERIGWLVVHVVDSWGSDRVVVCCRWFDDWGTETEEFWEELRRRRK
jgi:hypothetical protein